MLAELNSNNWPLGVKFLIAVTVVFLTALCGFLKLRCDVWLNLHNEENIEYYKHSLTKVSL